MPDNERMPSTGIPADYVYIEDFTDIDKGKRVCVNTMVMPEEADKAYRLWLQGKTHKSYEDFIEPNARKFTQIMGFSPEAIREAQKQLRIEISE